MINQNTMDSFLLLFTFLYSFQTFSLCYDMLVDCNYIWIPDTYQSSIFLYCCQYTAVYCTYFWMVNILILTWIWDLTKCNKITVTWCAVHTSKKSIITFFKNQWKLAQLFQWPPAHMKQHLHRVKKKKKALPVILLLTATHTSAIVYCIICWVPAIALLISYYWIGINNISFQSVIYFHSCHCFTVALMVNLYLMCWWLWLMLVSV